MNDLVIIEPWLQKRFSPAEQIISPHIVGSILYKPIQSVGDVDIVQNIKLELSGNKNLYYIDLIYSICNEFLAFFGKRLHVTTFTQNDKLFFEKFMNLNRSLRIL